MSTMSLNQTDVSGPKTIWDMVGAHHLVSFSYEIGREKVKEFARAVQDEHPAHVDDAAARKLGHGGIIAPVTFISVVGTAVLPELFANLLIGYGLGDILHSDQQIKLHRPIRVGDVLSSDLSLDSFRRSSGSDIMVTANDITDQFGQLVATTLTTFVARTGGQGENSEVGDLLAGIMRHGS